MDVIKQKEYKKYARDIIDKMTLDEKIKMIHGNELFKTGAVERLGIPALSMSDGPCGVRQDFEASKWNVVGNTRDYVSYMPCNSAIAATFNRKIAFEAGDVLGEETRGRGKDMILGPGVNIKRSPLCGRNFEYFSEDPYLTKEMAVEIIKGIQQNDVSACIKHFACNGQETERLAVDTIVDEDTLNDIYLPAFKAAVEEANVYSVMGAYNKLNGEHCCHSTSLLNKVLRDDWKFDGVVVSDWGGVHDTKEAAESGLDIEMSVTDNFDEYFMAEPLKKAIESHAIDEELINKKVENILVLMQRLHMIGDTRRKSGVYNSFEHQKKLLAAAEESIVLLKNEDNVLPIKPKAGERILLVGENANMQHAPGGGSAEIKALYEITPLMGLQMELGGNVTVDYICGYDSGFGGAQDSSWQAESLKDKKKAKEKDESHAAALRKEAVEAAANYDHVIFIGGLNHQEDCEGYDRKNMSLPYHQPELIKELLKIHPDMPVILIGGNPVEMGSWVNDTKGLIYMFYNGMEGGRALAEIILGKVNPSGRLPVSFYKKLEDCYAHKLGEFAKKDVVTYSDGEYVGYRYLDHEGIAPEFPFGFGLSYSKLEILAAKLEGVNKVLAEVRNAGAMDGKFVVQVFKVNRKYGFKELCGFEKINLKAGEYAAMEIMVDAIECDELLVGENYLDI
ncbi:MAG: glycoside hydrolase family 3 protein [Pseudobutyrivibrio sp.]|nr:glycoside hydrolase family 3 protein [Pseudobutyrivibrio sp.]